MREKKEDTARYADIIELPHPEPKTHSRMPAQNRAAQFSPFAALSGYDTAIRETQRQTEQKRELSEDKVQELNEVFSALQERKRGPVWLRVVYFQKDERKEGGRYREEVILMKRLDMAEAVLIGADHKKIPLEDIFSLEWVEEAEK